MKLFFRTDAGIEIGSGHLMRSFALAQSWQASGGKVTFITNCESISLIEKLKNEGFEVVEIENSYPHPSDWEQTAKVLKQSPDSWCVVDGYLFDSDYYGLIRQNGNRVLVVDDTVRLPFYDADAILNQNINAEKLKYNSPPETKLLLGTKYTMLRREFLKRQNFQRETAEIANKILITMGGSDLQNQTLKAIRAIEKLKCENLEVRVVVGSSNPHLAELEKEIEKSPVPIELIHNAENMPELMAWANLAISAAGSTCWELCFMKVPTVLIITAKNQNEIATGLDEAGFAENLGWFERFSFENLAEQIGIILFNKMKRKKMSSMGREIIDGGGTNRIVGILRTQS
jgi:UDP-2,4-diacetamido-2,4,6-trideoxy-beta-L-altropyranose hydrolase